VAPEGVRVTRNCVVPPDELEWRFSTSGGPGGQHANTSQTRAEVRFDIENSQVLGPRQRARLLERFGSTATATASDRRSQLQNRELALERLRSKLADALHIERTRIATKVSKAKKKTRVESKRKHGQLKRSRRPPGGDD